ncbi:MAG TPA: oligosaccharide flippase family protein, partial [Albitalea sp.]|nr:oligosaccharide flippase family protein [Albitalea sp.]
MQLTQATTLRQRVIHAGSWAVGGHVLGQAIRLGGNLILTRLLVPEAFGLMAIVYVLMIGFALFSDLGIGANIVQNPRGEDPSFLNTAWTVQIVRGIVIWVLSLLSAVALPVAASFGWVKAGTVYGDPLLPWVIAAFSFTAVIGGFDSTNIAVA